MSTDLGAPMPREDHVAVVTATSGTHAQRCRRDAHGFSLLETLFALSILAFGLLTLAAVLSFGLMRLNTGNSLMIARAKAAEAIESVFMSRDTRIITWSQVRNKADGGIFLGGPQMMTLPGADGMVNTDDDGPIEETILAGPDGLIGTPDDEAIPLTGFTREIEIIDLGQNLREIHVTIRYPSGSSVQSYTLMTYISAFA